MATKKKTKVARPDWQGYHKINLTDEQTEVFERDYLPLEVKWMELDTLANSGYKVSFNWDDYNTGISASLYCNQKKMEWAGYTLSAWAADAETALKLLLYKHYVVARETWEIVKAEREGSSAKFG